MIITFKLDILKPHSPDNELLARTLVNSKGVLYVQIKTDEIDQKTTSIFLTIKGSEDLTLDLIKDVLDSMNCSLHSVDEVVIEK